MMTREQVRDVATKIVYKSGCKKQLYAWGIGVDEMMQLLFTHNQIANIETKLQPHPNPEDDLRWLQDRPEAEIHGYKGDDAYVARIPNKLWINLILWLCQSKQRPGVIPGTPAEILDLALEQAIAGKIELKIDQKHNLLYTLKDVKHYARTGKRRKERVDSDAK